MLAQLRQARSPARPAMKTEKKKSASNQELHAGTIFCRLSLRKLSEGSAPAGTRCLGGSPWAHAAYLGAQALAALQASPAGTTPHQPRLPLAGRRGAHVIPSTQSKPGPRPNVPTHPLPTRAVGAVRTARTTDAKSEPVLG